MGTLNTNIQTNLNNRLIYINHLLDDLKSLEYLVDNNLLEKGVTRIGAEQEFCLVNKRWRPANNGPEILKSINDSHFTTEIARFNLELNLDPVVLGPNALQEIKRNLSDLLKKAKKVAKPNNDKIILVGILPTISWNELHSDFMTPRPRYSALNSILKTSRGGQFRMHFSGVDQLAVKHNSVMFEACNTSFQMHLQIDPDDFASSYNWAQAIVGPILGVSTNSPLLLGKELWNETRIALFQQSIDTRKYVTAQINQQARVSFGEDWVKGSIIDFYKHEVSSYKILLTKEIKKSSQEIIKEGGIPKLEALNLLNGSIYRWNRLCYGVNDGKPNIRIENRYIPAGPSIEDEMANFYFWVGLMKGRPSEYDDLTDKMAFSDVRANFIKAARYGSETIMQWMDKKMNVADLIQNILLPIAEKGLKDLSIQEEEIKHYLGLISKRLETQTGSEWMVKNYRNLRKELKQDDALVRLTEQIYKNQNKGLNITEWQDIPIPKKNLSAQNVGHIMSNILIKADPEDSAHLTLQFMKWNNIRHLPVVNSEHQLSGLITRNHVEQYWDKVVNKNSPLSASDIMVEDVIAVDCETPIEKAAKLMNDNYIGCLPVLQNDFVVGILTEKDIEEFENG